MVVILNATKWSNLVEEYKNGGAEVNVSVKKRSGLRETIANKHFKTGDTIVFLPRDLAFTCIPGYCYSQLNSELETYKAGGVSIYHNWFNILPSFKFFKRQMMYFKPKLMHEFRDLFDDQYLHQYEMFQNMSPVYQYAHCILTSRRFGDQPDENFIAGVIDMFNHDLQANAEYNFTPEGDMLITAFQPIKKNEVIRIMYSVEDNLQLAWNYGFVDKNNPIKLMPLSSRKCKRMEKLINKHTQNTKATLFIEVAKERCPDIVQKKEL